MFIQAFAILAYSMLGALVLYFWAAYKFSFRNIGVFVLFGGVGLMLAGFAGYPLSNEEGIIESSALVSIYLGMLAVGLFGGSFLGLKYFGARC